MKSPHEYRAVIESPGSTHNRRFLSRSTIDRYSHFSKNRRIASIEASKILSWPASHLSTVERDTPSSREIRAFFHFNRSAKVRKRIKISAISRSLRSFCTASISLGFKGVFQQSHTELNEICNSQRVFEKSPQMQGLRGPSPDVPDNRPNCIQPHARSIGEITTFQTPSKNSETRYRSFCVLTIALGSTP